MNLEYFLSKGENQIKLNQTLKENLKSKSKIKIVSGFLTKSGLKSISGFRKEEIEGFLQKLEYIVVGRLTKKTNDVFENLFENFPQHKNKFYVNLGLGKKEQKRNIITHFLPMIHSKIIAIDYDKADNMFYIGSANVTKFALEDNNAESGILLSGLNDKERKHISAYMDFLKNKKSTKLYDPEKAYDWMSLYRLMLKEEDKFLNQFIRIDRFSIVLCYNPLAVRFFTNNIFYTEITDNSNELVKDIHGIIHHKVNKYIIFYLFDEMEDLVNLNLNRATVYTTINTGLIKDPIKLNIDAILTYTESIPPFIIKKKTELTLIPSEEKTYQTTCEVINQEDLPDEYQKYCNLFKYPNLMKNLIATKRVKSKQSYTLVDSRNLDSKSKYNYFELKEFSMDKNFKTFNEVINQRKTEKIQVAIIKEFHNREKNFIKEISNIIKEGDLKKYLSDFEEKMTGLKEYKYKETLLGYTKQKGEKDEFIEFLAEFPEKLKYLISLEHYLFTINKTLRND